MAERTYVVTVASGNLYGGGTGNVFYLDGARNSTGPGTVSWVQGGTLRFDQSASSNDNHPLIFSTNTNTSGIISSGVTYYLDGSSNQANYTNTTTFNAATTRYVEITPSSQTDFYYLCYVHGIGMGGIFDITQSTWGALTWNQGAWSAQNDQPVPVTGVSLTSSIGTDSISANADVSVTGVSATINVEGENQIEHSEEFDDGSWTKNLGTLTADATIAPNGTKTADQLAETSGTGTHQIYETGGIPYSAFQVVTWSVFLKNNDRRYAIVILANGSTNWLYGVVDLQTGTTTASGSGATGGLQAFDIENYGNGWYRCSLRGFTQGSTNIFPKVILSDTGTPTITSYGNYSRTGDGSSSIFLWGAQLSDGFKQNYVPTFGTAVDSSTFIAFGSTLTMTGQQMALQIGEETIDIGVPVTGIQSSTSIGNATGVGIIEVGWGGDSWGENEWGDLSGSQPTITGQQMTSTIGAVSTTANADVIPTGIESRINLFGTNFQAYSQDLSQSNYTKRGNATATANYGIAPDGTKTSTLIANIQGNNTPGGTYSDIFDVIATNYSASGEALEASFWIKRVSGSSTALQFNNPQNAAQGQWNINFNSLSTTEFTRIDKNHSAVTVNNTYVSSGGGQAGTHFKLDASSNENLSFEVWGIQIEEGTQVTNYKHTKASPVNSIFNAGTSHDESVTGLQANFSMGDEVIDIGVPVTGIQTTINTAGENLVANSVDLDSSFPNQFRATVTSNAALSPFGTKDATTLAGNGSDSGTKVLFKFGFNTPSPGDIQTFSIFAKDSAGGTGGTFQLEIGNSAQRANVQFNITNGLRTGFAQSSEVSFVEGDSVNYGDGWYRFRLTVQYESSFDKPNTNIGIQLNGSDANDPGVILFGAQVEEQTALTNYKPTFGTAVSSVVSIDDTTLTGIGWGRAQWGNLGWGVAYSALPQGQQLTSTLNFPAANAFTDVNVAVTGSQMNTTFANPSFSIQIDQNIIVLASEDQLDASVGNVTHVANANVSLTGISATTSIGNTIAGLKLDVPVTGVQATMTLGNISLQQSTNEQPTGIQAALSIGSISEIPDQQQGVSGLQATSSVGSVTITGTSAVDVTGIQLTGSVGNVNVTPWTEIDPGVSNVWTEVDLAA